ncbi:hypothetical protein [Kitasatospora sp. Ki12]
MTADRARAICSLLPLLPLLPLLGDLAGAALAAGTVEGAQAENWLARQERRADGDRLFLAIPLFLAAARRPW